MPLSAGDRLGRYEIIAPLGAGGMGEVYRARDERLQRDVAVKVLPDEVAADPERRERFEREARAAAALDHQNITAVHELGEHEGRPFIVTELLEGQDFRSVIDSGGLTVRKSVEYAVQVANGLAAAHEMGIAHRDLKPENLFLTAGGTVKILDFGLAKLRPDQAVATETPTATLQTSPGTLVGTVAYMAPEQLRGGPADHRSDIFALGVVLYEMLAGSRPFQGSTAAETAAAILKEDAEPVSAVSPSVPSALASVVSQCLEKRLEDRFSSAHDLALALRAADESVVSPPPKPTLTVRRRWPHVLAVVIAAAIALFVVLPPEGLWQRLAGTDAEQPPIRSIALLPLQNLTGDPEQAYFVDGLHEELISTFAQISAFDKVIARTSVMGFRDTDTPIREIGRQLGADAVLEGSVRRSGETVRVTLQLIDAPSENHVWAESFDRDLTDILALQSEVARAVARKVRLALTPEEERRFTGRRAVDPEAYRLYLKGVRLSRWLGLETELEEAERLFMRAIERDPSYAEAHVGLSFTLFQLAQIYRGPRELMQRAYDEAIMAVQLDDEMATAHGALGTVKLMWQWDWSGAETHLRRALEQKPSDSRAALDFALFLIATGQPEEAVSVANRAVELDPLSVRALGRLGWIYFLARRYDEAIDHLESTLELHPEDPMIHYDLAASLCAAGRFEDADAHVDWILASFPGFRANPLMLASLAWARQKAGKDTEAAEAVRRLRELEETSYVAPTLMAWAYLAVGNSQSMFECLDRAADIHDTLLLGFVLSPVFDPIRADPRFQDILRRMNFPGSE